MNKVLLTLASLLTIAAFSLSGNASQSMSQGPYDPSRDAFQDFADAQQQAEAEDKLILIQIGGNWCTWCHKLERFFDKTDSVKQLRDETFVSIKVNVSPENENEAFLNEMPEFEGYPFLVITNAQGDILNSRTSGALEEGLGYSENKFTEYFTYWKNTER